MMGGLTQNALSLVLSDELNDEYFQHLKQKLRDYNRQVAPWMEPPDALPLNIHLKDESGRVVGGMAALTYWGWLVIKLMVLDDAWRGNGIVKRLMQLAHAGAHRHRHCHARTHAYRYATAKPDH
ncbi:MAG: GNAT family N-acetyltransferase [Ardenticatenales bacterium]|nr:GNAT family N-acetyltransferase [Ardenticatenales bacterium]